jgi:hypothetical protein
MIESFNINASMKSLRIIAHLLTLMLISLALPGSPGKYLIKDLFKINEAIPLNDSGL